MEFDPETMKIHICKKCKGLGFGIDLKGNRFTCSECTGTDERGHLTYTVTYTPSHNGHYLYGVRVMPWRDGLDNPLDSGMIQWG